MESSKPTKEVKGISADTQGVNNELKSLVLDNLGEFQWLNDPTNFDLSNGILAITTSKGTDFFNNPENGDSLATAPLLYKEVAGDFVVTTLVKPDFSSQWNACALMVHIDNRHWIKFAFENSDATGKSIVSVVTNNLSDDANGVPLHDLDHVWLRVIKKGNIYAMHWSADGETFTMARLSSLPESAAVKVGMEAQSPVGDSAYHRFLFFSVEQRTVKDMRKGE